MSAPKLSRLLDRIDAYGETLVATIAPGLCTSCWFVTLAWSPDHVHDAVVLADIYGRHLRRLAQQELDEPALEMALLPMTPLQAQAGDSVQFLVGRPDDLHLRDVKGP
jgi:hypothetical protein